MRSAELVLEIQSVSAGVRSLSAANDQRRQVVDGLDADSTYVSQDLTAHHPRHFGLRTAAERYFNGCRCARPQHQRLQVLVRYLHRQTVTVNVSIVEQNEN